MDPTQQTPYSNQPTNSGTSPLAALLQNKKLLIGFIVFILLVGIGILIMAANTGKQPSSKNTVENSNDASDTQEFSSQKTTQSSGKKVEPTIDTASPEAAAKGFYMWYVSHPAPLTSKAYEQREDITEEYKKVMARYAPRGITPGKDPIFNCGVPLPEDVTSLEATYDLGKGLALVILQDAVTGEQLFQIKLQSSGNKWLVRDVWCP